VSVLPWHIGERNRTRAVILPTGNGAPAAFFFSVALKISAKEFRALQIERDAFHGDWNYVIRPRAKEG
jgi:hypothetical protein